MKAIISRLLLMAWLLGFLGLTRPSFAGEWVLYSYEYQGFIQSEDVDAIFPSRDNPGRYGKNTSPGATGHLVERVYQAPFNPSLNHDEVLTGVGWVAGRSGLGNGKTPPGGKAALRLNVFPVYKWIPDRYSDITHDPPSPFIYVLEYSKVMGSETYVRATGHHFEFSNFNNGLGNSLDGQSSSGNQFYGAAGMHIGILASEGKAEVEGPLRKLSADVKMNPTYISEPADSWGDASLGTYYAAPPLKFTPNPDGLALMDCPPNSKTLNQYVMNGTGGVPFTIDSQMSAWPLISSDIDELLRQGFSWQIERAPLPMLAVAPNSLSRAADSISVKRRFYPPAPNSPVPVPGATPEPTPTAVPGTTSAPTPTPMDGMGFDTRGGLPASNGAFGLNKISHIFTDATKPPPFNLPRTIAEAPIALFYEPTVATHPPGWPKGYEHRFLAVLNYGEINSPLNLHNEIPTPNWFHYYSQEFPTPYGYQIDYRHTDHSGYYDGQDHVHIGKNAHGVQDVELFAKLPGATLVTQVGRQTYLGIDSYARVVTHECTHKRLYETKDSFLDTDGDGVPDVVEIAVGLNPKKPTTVPGTEELDERGLGADNEVFCRMVERQVRGNKDADWAAEPDSLNWGKPLSEYITRARCWRQAVPHPDDIDAQYRNVALEWMDALGKVP